MQKCEFCALEIKEFVQINECQIKYAGKPLKALNALSVFNLELLQMHAEIGTSDSATICKTCLDRLEACYAFAQQVKQTQWTLLQCRSKISAVVSPKTELTEQNFNLKHNLRRLLPKTATANSMQDATTQLTTTKLQRSYKCCECPHTFVSFRHLKTHEATHDLEGISICKYCCCLFANAEALEKHCKEMHADAKFLCLPCEKYYKNRGHLQKHIVHSHKSTELIYYCCLCPRQAPPAEYTSKQALQQHFQEVHLHMASNQAEDDVEIEMNEEFLDEFLLHASTNENSFQFSECWQELDLHLPDVLHLNAAQQHCGDGQSASAAAYKCPNCYEHFINQKTLIAHLAQTHAQQVLGCNKCEASFQRWEELWQHKAAHRLQDTVVQADGNLCKICDKTFKSVAALNYHIKTHSGIGLKPHSCPYCGKQFQAHINLKQHLRIVHSQLKRHVCLLCDKQFATLDHLKKHVLSLHQNERKHICHVCAKRFTQLCHLKQHLSIHTTGKTLSCDGCKAMFWRKIDLERHLLAKHQQGMTVAP